MTSSKYGLAKRVLNAIPGSRETLAASFTRLPDAVSPYVYEIARRTVFKDNFKRVRVFQAALTEAAKSQDLGHYLEFGVARGTSLITMYKLARNLGVAAQMQFHAFDSFEGLPDDEGHFVVGDMAYAEPTFRQFVRKAGVPLDQVTTSPGFFDKSLSADLSGTLGIKPDMAHIVHVDCDLYVSTVPVLEFLAPLLGKGSVIIFDDWFSFDDEPDPWMHGEQRAFNEWPLRDRFDPVAMTYPWNAAFKLVR